MTRTAHFVRMGMHDKCQTIRWMDSQTSERCWCSTKARLSRHFHSISVSIGIWYRVSLPLNGIVLTLIPLRLPSPGKITWQILTGCGWLQTDFSMTLWAYVNNSAWYHIVTQQDVGVNTRKKDDLIKAALFQFIADTHVKLKFEENYNTDYFSSSYVTYLVVYFTTKSLQLDGSLCWSFHLEVYYLSVHTITVHTELETGTSRPLKTPKKKQWCAKYS